MPDRPVLSARAANARALADAVLGDPGACVALDELVHTALQQTGADAGQLSMMTDEQVVLCPSGLIEGEVEQGSAAPFEETLCAQVLRANDAVVIPDTRVDQRVAGVGAVARGEWGAYLGVPVRVGDGQMVGVLCTFHRRPRDWSAEEQTQLRDLARRAGEILDQAALAGV